MRPATNLLFDAMEEFRPLSPDAAWKIIGPLRCALQRLLDGVGDADDLLHVAMGFNVAWVRVTGRNDAAMKVFEDAGMGIMDADRRGARNQGRILFTGPERQRVLEAVNLYDEVIRASTPKQLHIAARRVHQLVREAQPA